MGTDESKVDALMARFSSKRRELFAAELPSHQVSLGPLFIDPTEVTNAAFKAFVDAHREWSRERLPADRHNGEYLKTWVDGAYPAGEAELPVTFVTWHAAAAYCESAGKRLPTEAEWEFAAGRGLPAEFPWGDEAPDAAKASWSGTKVGKPSRVGSFPPLHGLYDMAGNVWEFTADPWKDSYTGTATVSPGRRVIRGGSFGGSPVNLRVRYRDSHPEPGAGPHVGFRCVRSMEAK
jgi:formylglycine-generating enzyme required for sulfatase activity